MNISYMFYCLVQAEAQLLTEKNLSKVLTAYKNKRTMSKCNK